MVDNNGLAAYRKLDQSIRHKVSMAEIVSDEIWSVENAIDVIRHYCGGDYDDTLKSLQRIVDLAKELEELEEGEHD